MFAKDSDSRRTYEAASALANRFRERGADRAMLLTSFGLGSFGTCEVKVRADKEFTGAGTMKQVQWKSSIGVLTSCGALFCASVPAQAIDLSRPALFVLVANKTQTQKCITIDGHEICIGKKKVGTPADGAPSNGAPQGGAGAQGGAAGAAGAPQGGVAGAPPVDNAGQGGGNAGAAQDGNAGAPPVDNPGTPPAGAADTALEPGEHLCPVGYLVLDTKNKFGAFCEAVEGFKAAPGTEAIERACPAGYVVLDKENKYHALCEPKEGFPAAPAN